MKIQPLHDKILVKETKETESKIGNILVPEKSISKSYLIGTVVAIGQGRYQNGIQLSPCVEIGERVLYMKYSANCYRDEENSLVIIREDDILGVITDESDD